MKQITSLDEKHDEMLELFHQNETQTIPELKKMIKVNIYKINYVYICFKFKIHILLIIQSNQFFCPNLIKSI